MTILAVWDFADVNSLFIDAGITRVSADGQLIYRCADKSGNGNHMEQSNAALRPAFDLNASPRGLACGLFDGLNSGLVLPSHAAWGNPFTQFIVARRTATDGNAFGRVFSHTASSTSGQVYTDSAAPSNQWGIYSGSPTATQELNGTLCDTWGILTIIWDEANVIGRWNSIQTTDPAWNPADGSTSSTFATMGSNGVFGEHFKGHIGEMQIHSGALSESELLLRETALEEKWIEIHPQMAVASYGGMGYGVNKKQAPYIPRDEMGRPQSKIRLLPENTKDPIFDSRNEAQ